VTRLDLVVGPNGAGKSSFVAITLKPQLPGSVFVNADEIAKRLWPEESEARSYDAARLAAETRTRLIETGEPFIAETVFSHRSKLDLIREAHASVCRSVSAPAATASPNIKSVSAINDSGTLSRTGSPWLRPPSYMTTQETRAHGSSLA
jgi:predicted kinase